jgi:hypothetical protein
VRERKEEKREKGLKDTRVEVKLSLSLFLFL